jgi:hypothetical protein
VNRALGRLAGLVTSDNELGASVDLHQRLFDTLALAGGDYGCLAWCLPLLPPVPHASSGTPRAIDNPVERAHLTFLRRLLRAQTSTPLPALYLETRRRPWTVRWASAVARFWNCAVATERSAACLTPAVLDANLDLWRAGASCWAVELHTFLARLGPEHTSALGSRQSLNDGNITAALCEQYDRTWSTLGDPRTPSTAHRPLATYKHWFWTEDKLHEERRTYLHTAAVPHRIALRVANFRFGHQCLRVNQRYTSDSLPFASRTCSRCTSGAIDDAAHLLFECTGAALPHVRSRFGALLTSIPAHSDAAGQLQFISNTANQASMAFFISDCMRAAQT